MKNKPQEYIKIKVCIWFNFGCPEIINTWAKVTKQGEYYYIRDIDGISCGFYKFASKERFFYVD